MLLFLAGHSCLDIAYSVSTQMLRDDYEQSLDLVCVCSRTGFIIKMASCLVLWKAVLQTESTTSTMEAEVVSLGAYYKELIPIIILVDEVGKAVRLSWNDKTNMHVVIHEDNADALILV